MKEFIKYQYTLGIATMTGRGFYYPVDVGIASNNRLYVLGRSHEGDTSGIQVCMMDHNSEYYGIFGSAGKSDGQFIWTTSIALDNQNNIYVSDEYLNRISIFDSSGKFLKKWGTPGNKTGQLNGPSGMAFDSNENLYIVDHKNNRIQKFSRNGDYISSFGSEGSDYGQMKLPWGITIAPDDNVYIADWGNNRIQSFTPSGKFVTSIGISGNGYGELHRPSSVAVDHEGFVYVADWGNDRIQVFDKYGNFVTATRGESTLSPWAQEYFNANVEEKELRDKSNLEPNINSLNVATRDESYHIEKHFWAPVSVKLDNSGRILVTDRNRHRIQVYKRTQNYK